MKINKNIYKKVKLFGLVIFIAVIVILCLIGMTVINSDSKPEVKEVKIVEKVETNINNVTTSQELFAQQIINIFFQMFIMMIMVTTIIFVFHYAITRGGI